MSLVFAHLFGKGQVREWTTKMRQSVEELQDLITSAASRLNGPPSLVNSYQILNLIQSRLYFLIITCLICPCHALGRQNDLCHTCPLRRQGCHGDMGNADVQLKRSFK